MDVYCNNEICMLFYQHVYTLEKKNLKSYSTLIPWSNLIIVIYQRDNLGANPNNIYL